MRNKLKITARIAPEGLPFTVNGQEARTLRLLVERGARGLAAWDVTSGPPWRLAAYVFDLRTNYGVPIDMAREPHEGGTHARYFLRGDVDLIEVIEPQPAKVAA